MPPIAETEIQENEKSDILRKLSQCIFNIRAIIEAHLTEPIAVDKELVHEYYYMERSNLDDLLETPTGILILPNKTELLESLSDNLLLNKAKTEYSRKQLDKADDATSIALGIVQRNRKYNTTKPTTGLENGPLKAYLTKYLTQKSIATNSQNNNIDQGNEVKRYEDIVLRRYRTKINGDNISRGDTPFKKVFNPTDVAMLYFLHNEFIKNKEKYFTVKELSEKINKKGTTIENRITEINKIMGKTISVRTPKIIFIKNKPKHGYHLNPDYLN
jgi:hypothetical protein